MPRIGLSGFIGRLIWMGFSKEEFDADIALGVCFCMITLA